MKEKYIRESRNSFTVVKSSKNYGKFTDIDDAIFVRNLLVENDWNLGAINELYKIDDMYIVIGVIDEKIYFLGKYAKKPSQDKINNLIKRKTRNPNNSKYGLNIAKVFETFVIKKRIAGDDYIFGYYDSLEDAQFVRNFLMDNMWNVNGFSQIEFDEDTGTYKVIEVIDDKVYVLDTFTDKDKINLKRTHEEFLSKISKHKFGLASSPHLDELTDRIPELEERFDVRANDDVWSFENAQDPLNDIIFNMTPFEKSVYDAIGDKATFDEIAQALIRFKTKNFEDKIQRNLDELIGKGLVLKKGDYFEKTNL